jgi:hypothetical protein
MNFAFYTIYNSTMFLSHVRFELSTGLLTSAGFLVQGPKEFVWGGSIQRSSRV